MKILIIDSNKKKYENIKTYFSKIDKNITVDYEHSTLSIIEAIKSENYDLAFLDFKLTLVDAEQLVIWLKDIRPDLNTDVYVVTDTNFNEVKHQMSKYNHWFKGCLRKRNLKLKINKIMKQYLTLEKR